jgi:Rieske Fe-S protein
MQRRDFTKTCFACLAGSSLLPFLSGCQSTFYTSGQMESNGISISKSDFTYLKKDQPIQRQYVIVRNDAMEFPIYVYRFSDNEFSAMLMKCTHQGNELQASGDHLHCSAHGSEFNNRGIVAQGPAEENLRIFPVTSNGNRIFIDLSA